MGFRLLALQIVMLAAPLSAAADTFYVQPGASNGNGTQARPWSRIAQANSAVRPGDTVVLMDGEYRDDPIAPNRSGFDGRYITYRAASGARPTLSEISSQNNSTAVHLDGRSWIKLDGIVVDGNLSYPDNNVGTWVSMIDSHNNVIENSTFRRARGWSGIIVSGGASFNVLRNNTFDEVGTPDTGPGGTPADQDIGDLLDMRQANNNLIEGNDFSRSGHNLFEVRGHYNVLRRNTFDNNWGNNSGNRIGELSGSTKDGVTGPRGFNLFEENTVRGARPAGDNPHPPAIKVQGQGQIVRRNNFVDHVDTAIQSAVLNPPVDRAIKNRIFHNNFDRIGNLWEFRDNGGDGPSHENIWKNNAIGIMSGGDAVLISLAEKNWSAAGNDYYNANALIGNFFASSSVDIRVARVGVEEISECEQSHPATCSQNRKTSFSLPNSLGPVSKLIDQGVPLTEVISSSGSGTSLLVRDAGYFSDGFGVIPGDRIRIGHSQSATVTDVNYSTGRLALGNSVSWTRGDPVNLEYAGSAPDVGAYESDLQSGKVPKPPVLMVVR